MSRIAYLKLAHAFWLMHIVHNFSLVPIAAHNRVAVA